MPMHSPWPVPAGKSYSLAICVGVNEVDVAAAACQFTLAADVAGGNRPSFTGAALPDEGRRLYDHFVAQARRAHNPVQTGQFGADMQIHLVNDGPVTIPLQF